MAKTKRRPLRRPRIVIESGEHARLMDLAETARARFPQIAEFLAEELSRSFIVPDGTCAANVVRMGSRVTYREDFTARVRHITLTYPHQANIDEHRISILTPIGAALIGLSIAQTIEWPAPDGQSNRLTVLGVADRPAKSTRRD
jgi:regulator of nucleoside diphosphate kinase